MQKYIKRFHDIGIDDVPSVGGKNASLGEMYNQLNPKGIGVPNGFAVTADAYRLFRDHNQLGAKLDSLLLSLDTEQYSNLVQIGEAARGLILAGTIPSEVVEAICNAYQSLSDDCGVPNLDVAVRSSATAEDLPTASFAGRM